MNTNKLIFVAMGFLSGIAATVFILSLYSFSNAPASVAPGGSPAIVTASVANTYFKNYMAGAPVYNQVIKGFAVDKTQLDAMNSILRENSALTGFRIYFGKDGDSRPVSIVVGIDSKGLDAVSTRILTTNAPGSPCPTVCDNQSPIIKD